MLYWRDESLARARDWLGSLVALIAAQPRVFLEENAQAWFFAAPPPPRHKPAEPAWWVMPAGGSAFAGPRAARLPVGGARGGDGVAFLVTERSALACLAIEAGDGDARAFEVHAAEGLVGEVDDGSAASGWYARRVSARRIKEGDVDGEVAAVSWRGSANQTAGATAGLAGNEGKVTPSTQVEATCTSRHCSGRPWRKRRSS